MAPEKKIDGADFNPERFSLNDIEEIRDGIISKEDLVEKLHTGEALILHGKRRSVAVGYGLLVKVNTASV